MIRERELERRLAELRAPDEAGAEERSWTVIQEAYSERTPVRPSRRHRQFAIALAGGLAVIAIGLSPAGAKVGDLVSDVVGVSEEDTKPELGTLPAAGELLVETEDGVWIVRDDGSKRLLGDFGEAAWSPHGRYVAVADGSALLALDPEGEVQWTLETDGPPSDIVWEGTEFNTRIAYRAGDDLYVVGGDGLGNRRVAADVGAPGRPLWIEPAGVTKVDPEGAGAFPYLLAYLDRHGEPRVVQDTGVPVDQELGRAQLRALRSPSAVDPVAGERRVARVDRNQGRSTLRVFEGGRGRVVFSGPGRITSPVWSPDGRWLVFGWLEADQWVFIPPDRPRRVTAIDGISSQFETDGGISKGVPRVRGWVLPTR